MIGSVVIVEISYLQHIFLLVFPAIYRILSIFGTISGQTVPVLFSF